MPLRIITGTMGSGKSYYGAELCAVAWKEGAVVHTNIDIVREEVEARGWGPKAVYLPDEPSEWVSLIRRGREGQENLVVIDESMLLFDSHDWQATKKKHRALLEFFVWSRKLGLDVYFIGQSQKGVDVSFTRMALEVVACNACKEFPFIGPFIVTLFGDFCRTWRYPTGQKTGKRKYCRFDQAVGSLYRTESTHGKFEDIPQEVGRIAKDEALPRRKAWALGLSFVLGLCLSFWMIKKAWFQLFSDTHTTEPTLDQAAKAPPPTVDTPDLVKAEPPKETLAPAPPRFRIWGVSDLGKLRFWEAGTGALVTIGEVYDEAVVIALEMSTSIFKARLDDGRIVSFRRATRHDQQPQTPQQAKQNSLWNPSSLGSIWPPSGSASRQP